jgi:hypothetical protein
MEGEKKKCRSCMTDFVSDASLDPPAGVAGGGLTLREAGFGILFEICPTCRKELGMDYLLGCRHFYGQ